MRIGEIENLPGAAHRLLQEGAKRRRQQHRRQVMRTVPRSERGFTLIELVIVIVILGILASVAIPKYEDMREQARTATLKGQLGAIRSAVSIQYARNALNGGASFPVLNGSVFADGNVPKEPVMNSS